VSRRFSLSLCSPVFSVAVIDSAPVCARTAFSTPWYQCLAFDPEPEPLARRLIDTIDRPTEKTILVRRIDVDRTVVVCHAEGGRPPGACGRDERSDH
jgi:hypothetical protein